MLMETFLGIEDHDGSPATQVRSDKMIETSLRERYVDIDDYLQLTSLLVTQFIDLPNIQFYVCM